MTPTLFGRLQTRIFLLVVVGVLGTALVTPFLPGEASVAAKYRGAYQVLAGVLLAGLVWELGYHLLQQFRWEKDWPAFFGLLTGINEGLLMWLLVTAGALPGDSQVPGLAFTLHFATTWLVTFVFVNGPMRVPFLRWRFRGGRLI